MRLRLQLLATLSVVACSSSESSTDAHSTDDATLGETFSQSDSSEPESIDDTTVSGDVEDVEDTEADEALSSEVADSGDVDVDVELLPNESWRYRPTVDGDEVVIPSDAWPATDGHTIYIQTISTKEGPGRSYLHAVDVDGKPLWAVETNRMMWPRPPIIDDHGDVLLIAQDVYMLPPQQKNGVTVEKWSSSGERLWQGNGNATVEDPNFVELQLASLAGAIDDNGNLYFVTGSYLRSLDAVDGHIRWDRRVVTGNPHGVGALAPTVVDHQIYIVDAQSDFLVFDTNGEVLVRREGLFNDIYPRWVVPSRTGQFVAGAYAFGIVTFASDGEILGLADEGFAQSDRISAIFDDTGVLYAKNLFGYSMWALHSDLSVIWQAKADWLAQPDTGLVIDDAGNVSFKSLYDLNLSVMSAADGALVHDERLGIFSHTGMVLARPGEVVLAAVHPATNEAALSCFKAPIGLPAPDAWTSAHGNFKNQRRIHSIP